MPSPFRLTIRWLNADAFPWCRVVIPGDPPRWDFALVSSLVISGEGLTSERLAKHLDEIRQDVTVSYTADQLRVLAVQMRKAGDVPLTDPMKYPWYSGTIDPYGDPAYQFECEYSGKAGVGTLLLWVAEIRVEA